MFDHILPEETEEQKVTRAQEDKHAYCRGKSDARKQLERDASVHYKTPRDKDCYNMGYSSGVYENNKVNGSEIQDDNIIHKLLRTGLW